MIQVTSAFPRRPELEPPDREGTAITLTDEANAELFDALGSTTGRELLQLLTDEPLPPADLAEKTDTSLQNVHYHLRKLEEAELIEQVGTWYSSRGQEMAVYAPTAAEVTISLET